MDVHGPPIRYPTPRVSSCDDADHHDNDSSFRASDDSTLAESVPSSPRQPPAYGAERAPPLYQEEDDPDHVKARRKIRRTLCIRLLTSIFITVLVSLIVAAVVARIHDSNINPDWSSNETASNKTNGTSFTVISSNKPSSAQLLVAATGAALQDARSTVAAHQAQTATATSTSSTSPPAPTSTAGKSVGQTVDCASMGVFVNATPVTDIRAVPTRIVPTNRRRKVHLVVDDGDADQMVDVSVYKFNGCLLSRASYRGPDGGLAYRCSLACPDKRWQTNQAREVVAEEWGACG